MNKLIINGIKPQDEYYTPRCMVDMIIPFIKKDFTVWCPFYTGNSEFVIALKNNGNKVIHSHICEGKDFLMYTPDEKFDIIVSNPPFTIKNEVFKKVQSFNIPYALVMGLHCLSYYEFASNFHKRKLQLLIPSKRISFDGNGVSFTSVYFCENLLPQDNMVIDNYGNDNSKARYKPSRMELDREKIQRANDPTTAATRH
jgi:hypothetical protein